MPWLSSSAGSTSSSESERDMGVCPGSLLLQEVHLRQEVRGIWGSAEKMVRVIVRGKKSSVSAYLNHKNQFYPWSSIGI